MQSDQGIPVRRAERRNLWAGREHPESSGRQSKSRPRKAPAIDGNGRAGTGPGDRRARNRQDLALAQARPGTAGELALSGRGNVRIPGRAGVYAANQPWPGNPAGRPTGCGAADQSRRLQDDSGDGRSWLLVVENAQSTPQPVWNEIQAMVHAMEASEGFAAIILVGPTKLAHLLAGRSLSPLATRMGTHVHLLPLDLDESLELVQARQPGKH